MIKKLILFDIDGTLISTGGLAVRLMVECVSTVLGHPIQWNIKDFVGNTDRNILATLFRTNGSSQANLEDFVAEALRLYLDGLPEILARDGVVKVLPGVKNLLELLETDERFHLGLLTGNIREGAYLKLSSAGLQRFFPVGAYGSDALKREDLPPFAIQRAEKYYHHIFEKEDVWLVGDSIHDVRCAFAHHLNCLAVASGRTTEAELLNYHPTAFVADLLNKELILSFFSN
jgi:phosphoglycolate phosphatase